MKTLERISEESKNVSSANAVKVTALAYIREAVAEEKYEELNDMVAIAREFGAAPWDIRIALMPPDAVRAA